MSQILYALLPKEAHLEKTNGEANKINFVQSKQTKILESITLSDKSR